MLTSHPGIRLAFYLLAVVSQIAAFFVRASLADEALAEAFNATANLLAAVAGVTAITNIKAERVD